MSPDETAGNHEDEEGEMTEEQRAYMKEMIQKLMEKGIFVAYGDEDGAEAVIFDESGGREFCRSICCSFTFALTKKDVEKGVVKWNPKRPYFVARDEDGYCPHLDRETFLCTIWEDRPERCRNYDCRNDLNVWDDWERKILNKDVFNHLPE
jgi:Fe-S-cluster containining protein